MTLTTDQLNALEERGFSKEEVYPTVDMLFDTVYVINDENATRTSEYAGALERAFDYERFYEEYAPEMTGTIESFTDDLFERGAEELFEFVDMEAVRKEAADYVIQATKINQSTEEALSLFGPSMSLQEAFDYPELVASSIHEIIPEAGKTPIQAGFSVGELYSAMNWRFEDKYPFRYAAWLTNSLDRKKVIGENLETFKARLRMNPDYSFDDMIQKIGQSDAEELVNNYVDMERIHQSILNQLQEQRAFDSRYDYATDDLIEEYFERYGYEEAIENNFAAFDRIYNALIEKEEIEYAQEKYKEYFVGKYGQEKAFELLPNTNAEVWQDLLSIEPTDYDALRLSQKETEASVLNQKQLKSLKRDIVEDGALQIGYRQGVKAKMLELDPDIVQKAVAGSGGWVGESLMMNADSIPQQGEFDNILVTEMVRNLNYQDFKEVAPYFFQYSSMVAENGQSEIIGQDLDMSHVMLQKAIEEGALDNGVRFELPQLTLSEAEEGYDIIAYNPLENRSVALDLSPDGQQFELYLANQFGDKMGTAVMVSEDELNNPIVSSDKVYDLFKLNGIDKDISTRFASMDVIDRLEESEISFNREQLEEALSNPKQMEAVDQLIDRNDKQQVRVTGPKL